MKDFKPDMIRCPVCHDEFIKKGKQKYCSRRCCNKFWDRIRNADPERMGYKRRYEKKRTEKIRLKKRNYYLMNKERIDKQHREYYYRRKIKSLSFAYAID